MAKTATPSPPGDYKLAEFVTTQEWLDAERGKSFDTSDKLDWFIRQHRAELIASGEFIPGRGARPSLLGPGFDTLAPRLLRRQGANQSPA